MIIGLTGYFCAGKDTAARILESRGFAHISLSEIIREELRARGEGPGRDAAAALGNALRRDFGAGVLATRALERMQSGVRYAVTSIRHPDEVEALRSGAPGGGGDEFRMWFIDTNESTRFERFRRRDGAAIEDRRSFLDAEAKQRRGASSADQQLDACRALAEMTISNDGTIDDLAAAIDAALAAIDHPAMDAMEQRRKKG